MKKWFTRWIIVGLLLASIIVSVAICIKSLLADNRINSIISGILFVALGIIVAILQWLFPLQAAPRLSPQEGRFLILCTIGTFLIVAVIIVGPVLPTSTGEVTPSPTTVIAPPTTSTGLYQDPLTNSNAPQTSKAHWLQNSTCAFQTDGYHVMISQLTYQSAYCNETGYTYQDATISIDVKIRAGSQAALLFRTEINSAGTLFGYEFQIDVNGCYYLGKYNLGTLQNTTCSPIINVGLGATNSLKVVLSGSKLRFFANGTSLGTPITDSTFNSGAIALLAGGNGTAVDVTFSNITASP